MENTVTVHLNPNATVGPLLISLFVSTFLFGVSSVQGYLYQANFGKDRLSLKIMVLVVWTCELAHCVCIIDSFYRIGVLHWGDPSALEKLPHSFLASIALSGVIGTITQVFFAERLRVISGKLHIPVLCWTLSITRASLVLATVIKAWTMASLIHFDQRWKWLWVLTLSLGTATDFLLAVLLCIYLKVAQRFTGGHTSTSVAVNKISLWTMQTGLLTSLTGLAILISFLTIPNNFTWLGIYSFLVRIFSNSLFASLNGRVILREGRPQTQYLRGGDRDNAYSTAVTGVEIQVTKMV
ncbi:hypothetical protein CPC08DRAFT_676587, partial [Agrocybe pediades]